MSVSTEIQKLVDELDKVVLKSVPKAKRINKYGGLVYTLKPDEKEAQFCGVFPYKTYVQLSFSNGKLLKDPKRILCGTGKFRRHVNFSGSDTIDTAYLETLIIQASKQRKTS